MSSPKPLMRLLQAFFAWKSVLLIVTALAPGPGYDTSGLIALDSTSARHVLFESWSASDRVALNVFRWDALYFVKSSQRGYNYEQEWAFSWAYSLLLKTLVKLTPGGELASLRSYVWVGMIFSNACHLVSVLALYRLSTRLLGRQRNSRLPFAASMLHIVSPAGMFLSSPYAESLFAALNFVGMDLYAQARATRRPNAKQTFREDALTLAAGTSFLFATWIRSNGLLSGLLFLSDVVSWLVQLPKVGLVQNDVRRIIVTCCSGAILGLGSVVPQYVGYQEYCVSRDNAGARPWCSHTLPSIYTWVQSHYWNVGFLRYWTIPNIPLFLIAGPMLWLLLQTGLEYLRHTTQQSMKPPSIQPRGEVRHTRGVSPTRSTLPQLALPQLILAVMATTNFHVQVINRLSSGYPIHYLVTARWMTGQTDITKMSSGSRWICRAFIMYALIQGALFANFLPPA